MSLRDLSAGRPQSRRAYLNANAKLIAIVAVMLDAVVAAVATSRATNHQLSGVAVAVAVGFSAASLAAIAAFTSGASGVLDTDAGLLTTEDDASRAAPGWDRRSLWRGTGTWFVATAAWAGAFGAVLAAVLNGRVVGFPVLFVAMAVAGGLGMAVATVVAQSGGLDAARAQAAHVAVPLRRRAWNDIAPVFAVVSAVTAAGMAVLLFHDYATGTTTAAHALTKTELLRDLLTTLVIVGTGNAFGAGRAGRADALTGVVAFDDPVAQRPSSPYRRPAFVYAVVVAYVLVTLTRSFIPATPSLAAAAAIRALYCAALAYVVAGLAYVRGAANTLGAKA